MVDDSFWKEFEFHPVVKLPKNYKVLDLSKGEENFTDAEFSIGKYNEKRENMYTDPQYNNQRNIHMGIDIGAPVGTPIYSFYEGEVFATAYHPAKGDYGATLITKHQLKNITLYALYGHLTKKSISSKRPQQRLFTGEEVASVGDFFENGGWRPHLHFQLSFTQPKNCDLPGVVSTKDHQQALKTYPNPLHILGPLYPQ